MSNQLVEEIETHSEDDSFQYIGSDIPNPDEYTWEFSVSGCVGVWNMTMLAELSDEELEAVSEHYRLRGSEDDIDATVAVFHPDVSLPKKTQEFMSEQWSANAEFAGVERVAFVSEGIKAMAVMSNITYSEGDVKAFKGVEEAVEWCSEVC